MKDKTVVAPKPMYERQSKDGITATAYRGDGMVLLAFDLDQTLTKDLAGFAVQRKPPGGQPTYLLNRLNFSTPITSKTTPEQRTFTPTNEAPFQKFRWIDFPPDVVPGPYIYSVSAMYFQAGRGLRVGPTVDVSIPDLAGPAFPNYALGFTRGYLSSQAYADRFQNKEIRPTPKTMDYDTTPYEQQYEWLGWDARRLVFQFLNECVQNQDVTVDAFTYDLDEPDFIRGLEKLGTRLRLIQDDAALHTGSSAMEPKAVEQIRKAGASVKLTHFTRFSHDKVLIQKDRQGKPIKVLTGSANFSVRGLYVQANNTMVLSDPAVAQRYEEAFQQSFTDPSNFSKQDISTQWFDFKDQGLPVASVCFSPHHDPLVSLGRVAQAIQNAKSSVLFAIMELGGGGPVLDQVKQVATQGKIFTYGVTQAADKQQLGLFKPGDAQATVADFAYLQSQVPQPFRQEWGGGMGQVIHHKFVAVDFNGANPIVFAGSSNLSSGGEQNNGDNLLAISDPAVATAFGVEAIRLFDHYHFRDAMRSATQAKPLTLQGAGDPPPPWWQPYFDKTNIKYRDRSLFAEGPGQG